MSIMVFYTFEQLPNYMGYQSHLHKWVSPKFENFNYLKFIHSIFQSKLKTVFSNLFSICWNLARHLHILEIFELAEKSYLSLIVENK